MNPIDQMMQAYGNSPSEALAGLLGISPSAQQGGVDTDELAAQFAEALETAQQTGDISAALPGLSDKAVEQLDLANLTPDQIAEVQSELLARLGVEAPSEAGVTVAPLPAPDTDAAGTKDGDKSPQPYLPSATLVSYNGLDSEVFAQLQQAGVSFNEAGIAVVPLSELEALGLSIEQLPALPTMEQLAATGQAAATDSSRVIQNSSLQAALTQPQRIDPAAQNSPQTTGGDIDPLLGEEVTNEAAASKAQVSATAGSTEQSSGTGPDQTGDDAATASQMMKAAQVAADQAKQQEETADAEQAARTQAEGHGTTTVAAQQAAGKKADGSGPRTTASGTAPANTAGDAKDGIKLSAKVDGDAATNSLKETLTHQAVAPTRAKADAQAPQHTTSLPKEQIPWTPERLAGETTSASAMASGLAGLRGDSSLMNGMGLLGGRASPELGHQVGQQLNASVTKAVKDGQQEFTLRLNPSELGRVQVKLNFLEDGRVQAKVMAERPETLELLQRDTRGLERALEAGGGKADGSIEFSLEDKDGQSAGKSFAEAMQQEKMREQMDGGAEGGGDSPSDDDDMTQEVIPLEEILSQVTVETGLDVRV